jgi:hypothetical protein
MVVSFRFVHMTVARFQLQRKFPSRVVLFTRLLLDLCAVIAITGDDDLAKSSHKSVPRPTGTGVPNGVDFGHGRVSIG